MGTRDFILFYILLSLRYVFIAGSFFLIFYFIFRKKFSRLRIQKIFPKKADYYREIGFSFLTFIIFALIGVVLLQPSVKQYTHIYSEVAEYGWGYFGLSVLLALLIHDAYFYLTHRLMHHPRLFRLFHLTHHRSTNPSPWAAFAFNPLEAVVEGSVIVVIAVLIPIHQLGILLFLLVMTVLNVIGHLGYEIYPQWLVQSKLGKWLNTSTNHNMHHKYFKSNYGLYLRVWDEVFRTTHPEYEKTLQKLTAHPTAPETENSSVRPA